MRYAEAPIIDTAGDGILAEFPSGPPSASSWRRRARFLAS
jgi:hypothetical protein